MARTNRQSLEPSELQLHRSVAEYLDWALIPPAVWTTFPAGWGALSPVTAGRLKGCGLKPGFPDCLVFDLHAMKAIRPYTKVVGIELKAPGEKPSAAQQLMFPRLRALGIAIHVCESIEDVEAALRQEGIALRFGLQGGRRTWQEVEHESRKRPPDETSERRAEQDAGEGNGSAQRTAG